MCTREKKTTFFVLTFAGKPRQRHPVFSEIYQTFPPHSLMSPWKTRLARRLSFWINGLLLSHINQSNGERDNPGFQPVLPLETIPKNKAGQGNRRGEYFHAAQRGRCNISRITAFVFMLKKEFSSLVIPELWVGTHWWIQPDF